MLKISGVALSIDSLLESTTMEPDSVYRQGEPRFASSPNSEINESSGVCYLVSNHEFNQFEAQKNDAIKYLFSNIIELKKIMGFPGVEEGELDFGIYRRDVAAQCDRFPVGLIKLAGEIGVSLKISQYWPSEEEPSSANPIPIEVTI